MADVKTQLLELYETMTGETPNVVWDYEYRARSSEHEDRF